MEEEGDRANIMVRDDMRMEKWPEADNERSYEVIR